MKEKDGTYSLEKWRQEKEKRRQSINKILGFSVFGVLASLTFIFFGIPENENERLLTVFILLMSALLTIMALLSRLHLWAEWLCIRKGWLHPNDTNEPKTPDA